MDDISKKLQILVHGNYSSDEDEKEYEILLIN
jgi:hypothetical protein